MLKITERRAVYNKYFPMIQIGKSASLQLNNKALQNSCPGCGYFTLMGRGMYDICPICFWEDEGFDENELEKESEANPRTLAEHRHVIEAYITEIVKTDFPKNDIKNYVKEQIRSIDAVMQNISENRRKELLTEQGKLIALFTHNKIFGLDGLMKQDL